MKASCRSSLRASSICPRASCAAAFLLASSLCAQTKSGVGAEVQATYPGSETLYLDLHRDPELSSHETETAAKLATALQQLGYEVTTGVGRLGVVGVLKNGAGPTVLLRTELDALPVTENTGLPFASTVRTKDDAGNAFDAYIRESDGYPIKYVETQGGGQNITLTFDKYNTGEAITAPPADQIQTG